VNKNNSEKNYSFQH